MATKKVVTRRKKSPIKNDFESHIRNGLAQAIGIPSNNFFGAGAGYNPFAPQVSQVNTLFDNLRWYLVSNFRQPLSESYVEIGLIQTVVDVPVDDALRGGIEINSKQLDETQIKTLNINIDRDDDLQIVGQGSKWQRLFGGAGILILVDDQDPDEPLDIAAITKDSNLEFRAADLWELFPDSQNVEGYNPTTQDIEMEHYNYYGKKIHISRVMKMNGRQAPSFLRPRLRGWGLSEVEALIRSMNQYLKATDLAFSCLDEFKVDVYKIKNLINTLMSPDGEQQVRQRIQVANAGKNYQNALILDGEDDWDHKQISFAGLAETMQGIRMQVAADMRMPITKLFGTSASAGMGTTDQNDMENYNSMVESQVRNKIKYIILKILEIKCQVLFGFIPDDLEIKFKPLRVMTAEQEENVKTSQFTRLLQARQSGEIDGKDFKDACNKNNLLPIQIDSSEDDLTVDDAEEGDEDPYKEKTSVEDGDGRRDSKPEPWEKLGLLNEFKESEHPRADDGKFGDKGSSAKKSVELSSLGLQTRQTI